MPNRLIHETSPYLLQHAHNPVDWYAWSDEALERARKENKPILLSIGYSACHWCHVMEHESFENAEIAKLMNDNFINIKVDREERPDLDQVYMSAVQIMTGSGGWPLTVFLLPDGEPFYGGTYFPPDDRYGRPGFPRLLMNIAEAYRSRQEEVRNNAQMLRQHLNQRMQNGKGSGSIAVDTLDQAARSLGSRFDPREGGFGNAPKFPASMSIDFLLRYHHRTRTITRSTWRRSLSTRWPMAECTTRLEAVSIGTPRTIAGLCLTSKRCCTTTRFSRAPTWTPIVSRRDLSTGGLRKRFSTSSCAKCETPTAASTPHRTPTAKASRASSTSGIVMSSWRSSAKTANFCPLLQRHGLR